MACDPSSYARPDQAKITHSDLDWRIDFSKKIITGSVLHTVELQDKSVNHVILDSRDLTINSVIDEKSGQNLRYTINDRDNTFGSKISIILPICDVKSCIRIFYETSPSASGLQWLDANQTAGKRHPYMFSQCQSIHARSLVPCQDTPSVKSLYAMKVTTQEDVTVLMGALRDGEESTLSGKVYKFHQPVPIPAYLLAIAAGDLVSRDIGPRSKVWSEKEFVDKAAHEFAETDQMLSIAESLCGKYEWGIYDILVLPPSYPYGGMENPCLTFATPTLLAGDRSLADVIAHEITHSWTGNLITNENWAHMWLNEGFTVFIESKIKGKMHGEPARHLSGLCNWKDLQECIRVRGEKDPLTALIPDLEGVDPEDSFSRVPYIKGSSFLWILEQLLGGPEIFDKFLKSYIQKFRLKSIGSSTFRDYLYEYFHDKTALLDNIDWKGWWYTAGMPPQQPKFDTSLTDACTKLCSSWISWDIATNAPFQIDSFKNMSTDQKILFLTLLLGEDPLPLDKIKKLDKHYDLSSYQNAEIKCLWLRLCIKSKWEEKIGPSIDFVNEQGRMKFCRPIYRDLYNWDLSKEKIVANFHRQKDTMMHVSTHCLTKDLKLT